MCVWGSELMQNSDQMGQTGHRQRQGKSMRQKQKERDRDRKIKRVGEKKEITHVNVNTVK